MNGRTFRLWVELEGERERDWNEGSSGVIKVFRAALLADDRTGIRALHSGLYCTEAPTFH
jgi:hypothetical protein